MTKNSILFTGLLALSIFFGSTVPANAAVIVSDDFNDDSGTLTGETTNTGQIWSTYDLSWIDRPMDIGSAYGQGGTPGAGYADADDRGNYLRIPLLNRKTLTDLGGGSYTVSFDMNKGTAIETGFELLDGSKSLSIMWAANKLKLGGNNVIWDMGEMTPGTGSGYGGQIHVDFNIDVDAGGNSTATFSYYGIADPDGVPYAPGTEPSGSLQGTSSSSFAFNGLSLWADGNGSVPPGGEITAGFDNLSVAQVPYVPTPPPVPTFAQGVRRLMLDSRNIESVDNALLRVGTVQKNPANPLFGEEHPWEPYYGNLYPNVIYDEQEQIYKAWFSVYTTDDPDDISTRTTGVGYATSVDGINWTKPLMDKVLWDGELTNLLMEDMEGVGVIKDMNDPDPSRRYKMFGKLSSEPFFNSLGVAFSPDGVNWTTPTHAPEAAAAADTHNNTVWVPELNKYVGITRLWSEAPTQRIVGRTTSEDFVTWTEAAEVLRGDLQHQTYSMRVFPYAGVYLGFASILTVDPSQPATYDHMTTELCWSLDGIQWERIDQGNPLLGNSSTVGDYDWGCVNSAIPIFTEDEILIYYGSNNGTHGEVPRPDGFLALATLRPDGFAGYEPVDGFGPAVVVTTPFTLSVTDLMITADAQGGSVIATLLDDTGTALFSSDPITSNVTDYSLTWGEGVSLESLIGQQVSLRFDIDQAKVYSFVIPLTGDANFDGVVDETDAAILASHWQKQTDATWADGDFNSDNKVDDRDATILAANWGATASPASVPEPAILSLLMMGLFFTSILRRGMK